METDAGEIRCDDQHSEEPDERGNESSRSRGHPRHQQWRDDLDVQIGVQRIARGTYPSEASIAEFVID
jgi:hypothetical protein